MAPEEAKTLTEPALSLSSKVNSQALAEQTEGMASAAIILFEHKSVKNIEISEGFCSENMAETCEGLNSVLCKNTGNGGFSDNIGSLGTEIENGGNYRYNKGGALGHGVLCKDSENGGDSVNKEIYDKILGQSFGSQNREVLLEKAIVQSGFSENYINNVDRKGISLYVDFSKYKLVGSVHRAAEITNYQIQENEYSIGDFVWSKFNCHPWWPAQIYDPLDASDYAKKCRPNGNNFLVAYFGDSTFSWRSTSQLKPFAENFDELSKKNDSPIFLTAVKDALDEIGWATDLKMTCLCRSEYKKVGLIRGIIINTGIKKGVVAPECDFCRLPINNFKPLDLLSKVKCMAEVNSWRNMLEFIGLRGYLSAFYRFRNGRKFDDCYYEGLVIDGLKDKGLKKRSYLQKCGEKNHKKKREKKRKNSGKLAISSINEVSSEEMREIRGLRKRKKNIFLSSPYINDGMMTIYEQKNENKNNKRAKKDIIEVKNDGGLLFVKQKLQKMTKMVENCDGDKFSGMKLSLEREMRETLEKLSAMTSPASS